MQNFRIYDEKGQWFVNTGRFTLVDGDSKIPFDPGMPTKATETEWLKSQPTIVAAKNPVSRGDEATVTPIPGSAEADVQAQMQAAEAATEKARIDAENVEKQEAERKAAQAEADKLEAARAAKAEKADKK